MLLKLLKSNECYADLAKTNSTSTKSPSSKKLLIDFFRERLSSFIVFCNTHKGIPVTDTQGIKLIVIHVGILVEMY